MDIIICLLSHFCAMLPPQHKVSRLKAKETRVLTTDPKEIVREIAELDKQGLSIKYLPCLSFFELPLIMGYVLMLPLNRVTEKIKGGAGAILRPLFEKKKKLTASLEELLVSFKTMKPEKYEAFITWRVFILQQCDVMGHVYGTRIEFF